MSLLREIYTNQSNGIPKSFSKVMKVGKRYDLVKGQLNKLRIRPTILNEHAESSRENMGTISASNIIGQIFKASQETINGLMLTLSSAAGTNIDTFESYVTDAELQAVWVASGADLATIETTIVNEGSQSMKMPANTLGHTWIDTISSTDFTNFTFSFPWYQDKEYAKCKFEFILSDGIDILSFPLTIVAHNQWTNFEIDINAMTDSGTTNKAAITSVGFRVLDREAGFFGYVDNIIGTPAPGSVKIKLWDCGATLPVADGATFDLTNNATQNNELGDLGIGGTLASEVDVPLRGGKRVYYIEDFITGVAFEHPSNNTLTIGNYYAVTIHHVDTTVNVWGPDTTFSTNYYNNGYAFYTSAENVDITKINGAAGSGAYSDLMFGVFSIQDIYILSYQLHFNAESGGPATTGVLADWITFIEDSNMVIESVVTTHGGHAIIDGFYKENLSWRPPPMEKGGKFEVYYNDDYTDSVAGVELEYHFAYAPPNING
jgi:hypothetical protein